MAAAETAADFAAVLYTDAPANGEADPVEPMDLVELERRMATVLPGGWRLGQIQAQQPTTTNLTRFQVALLPPLDTPRSHFRPWVVADRYRIRLREFRGPVRRQARRTVDHGNLACEVFSDQPEGFQFRQEFARGKSIAGAKTRCFNVPSSSPTITRCSFPRPLLISVWYTPYTYPAIPLATKRRSQWVAPWPKNPFDLWRKNDRGTGVHMK